MKKVFAVVFGVLFLGASAVSQSISISANVVDSDTTVWANGTWQLDFVPSPATPGLGQYYYNNGGTAQHLVDVYGSYLHQTGAIDGSGNVISAVALNNTLITPVGSQWKLTLCPKASSKCGNLTFAVTSGPTWTVPSANITAAIPAPRFDAVSGSYGYADVEAITSVAAGGTYWNVTSANQECYTGSVWQTCSSGNGKVNPAAQFSIYGQPNTGSQSIANPLPNISSDASGNVSLNSSISKVSPVNDIRAYGAKIDGVTDIGAALNSAIAACNAANGNACTVLLPCAGPNNCDLANGSGISYSGSNVVTLKLQGSIDPQSTLVLPDKVTLVGDSGCSNGFFQGKGQIGCVNGPNVKGTLGTAITVTGSSSTFTPAFTAGSIANFHVASAITVAGLQTCSATASRTSASAGSGANTIFTLTSCKDSSGNTETGPRTPVGALVTVTGCSDSTVNITNSPVVSQDWPNNLEGIYESGATTTATGCTVTGFDDNTYETVPLTAVSGSTATAVFAHKHAASDLFGMVAVTFAANTYGHHYLKDIAIGGSPGVELWMDSVAEVNLDDVSVQASANMTSGAIECAGCWQSSWDTVYAQTTAVQGCTSNCTQPSYPYGIRFTQDAARNNGIGGSITPLNNLVVDGGIKIDTAGMPNSGGAGVNIGPINGGFFEQIAGAAVMVDPRYTYQGQVAISMNNILLQDDFQGNTFYYIGATDCCISKLDGFADLGDLTSLPPNSLANQYWLGGIKANNVQWNVTNPASAALSTGLLSYGDAFMGNFAGANAGLAPNIVPIATLPTNAISCSTCSTITGPDGVANSASEIKSTSGGAWQGFAVGTTSVGTYAGDMILFGAYCKPGTGETSFGGFWGINAPMDLETSGTDKFFAGGPNNQVFAGAPLPLVNGTWQHCGGIAKIATGESASHGLTFTIYSVNGVDSAGNDFYDPWWAFIPGPNNPSYAGVTQQEAVRWAEEMFKGYVPSGGYPGVLYANPNFDAPWGSLKINSLGFGLSDVALPAEDGTPVVTSATSTSPSALSITTNATNDLVLGWFTTNGGWSSEPGNTYVATSSSASYYQMVTQQTQATPGASGSISGGTLSTSGAWNAFTLAVQGGTLVGTPTQAYATSGTSLTVNVVSGVKQGDMLLACPAGSYSLLTSAGWTQIGPSFTATGNYMLCEYHIATASEPSSYTFNNSSSSWAAAIMIDLRPAKSGYMVVSTGGTNLTMNNSGSGAASGTTYNGTAAETLSYNTIGAAPAMSNCTAETANFTAAAASCYYFNSSSTITATLPAISTGAIILFQNVDSAAGTLSFGSNISCSSSHTAPVLGTTCSVPAYYSARITTDGSTWYAYVY